MSKSFWLLVFLFSFVPVVQAQLKLQYDPLEKMEGDEKPALHLEAQQITGTKYRGWLLQGESEIRQASSLLRASLIDYDEIRQELVAQGNVRLATGGNVLDSRSIRMRFPTGEGDAQDASFFIRSVQVRGRASEADFQVDHHLKLKNVAYTNCPAGNDDWLLTASELNMDYVGQKGHAIFPVLRFKGVPIFALPYIEFPLGSERRSGFLAPALGTGDSVGRYVNIPYYWNISPSQDATITPKFFSERGLLSEVQYRYLAPNFGGTLQVEQISDRVQKKSRWFLLSEHQQTLFPNALLFWNYKKTSDTTYLSDLGLTQEQTGQTALRQEFGTQYTTPLTKTMLRTLGFQSLGTASVADQEYSRKPQLLFQFQKSDTDNFDWGADLDYNQFRHPTKVEADRFVGQLSTGYTIKKSWGFLSPKLKMNLSQYRVFGLGTRDVSRSQSLSIPQFSVDSGLFFDRNFTWFGQDIRQSFEPRLVYQYTPYRDQSQLPVFDTATTNFNFTSIFSDNVYTGKDRVVNANQVTLGAQTRFFSRWDSTELIRLALARRFYFTEQKVSLPGEVVRVSKDSDYLGAASVNLGSRWQADAAVQYSAGLSRFEKSTWAVRWKPEAYKTISLAYRSDKSTSTPLQQAEIGGQWKVSSRWVPLVKFTADLKAKKVTERLFGVEYRSSCWVFRVAYHLYPSSGGVSRRNIFFQLSLDGLGGVGKSPLSTFKTSVLGYQPLEGERALPRKGLWYEN